MIVAVYGVSGSKAVFVFHERVAVTLSLCEVTDTELLGFFPTVGAVTVNERESAIPFGSVSPN